MGRGQNRRHDRRQISTEDDRTKDTTNERTEERDQTSEDRGEKHWTENRTEDIDQYRLGQDKR